MQIQYLLGKPHPLYCSLSNLTIKNFQKESKRLDFKHNTVKSKIDNILKMFFIL